MWHHLIPIGLALGVVVLASPVGHAINRDQAPRVTEITAAEFFTTTRVWDAHLTLTPDAWRAMQPQTGGGETGFGFGGMLGPDGGRNGVSARQGIEFDYVRADLEIAGRRFRDVAVRYKGNGSYLRARGTEKISLKADFNKYVKGQKLAGLTTINFQNNITDIGWMNEVVAYRLYRDAGALAPRTAYARVYLTVEGQTPRRYLGLYSISENVDENFIEDRFGTRKGTILKPSTSQPFTDIGPDWRTWNQTYDPKTDLTDADTRHIMAFGRLVSSASDAEFDRQIDAYVDLDAFATYFAVLAWIANTDSLLRVGQNYYTYIHPETRRLYFIAWDQDFSFGNFRNTGPTATIDAPWSGSNPFLGRIYALERFRTAYLQKMRTLSETLFVPERFEAQVAEIAPAIRPSIAIEGAEWLPGFDAVASGVSGLLPYIRTRAKFVATELDRR